MEAYMCRDELNDNDEDDLNDTSDASDASEDEDDVAAPTVVPEAAGLTLWRSERSKSGYLGVYKVSGAPIHRAFEAHVKGQALHDVQREQVPLRMQERQEVVACAANIHRHLAPLRCKQDCFR